jgi:thioredoxin reductase
LRTGGAGTVVVVEREADAGGVPRHCEHTGFGIRDLRRVLGGPEYASRWVDRATDSGAEIWTRTMVTGWSTDGHAEVTGPMGLRRIAARTVVLATGARERSRAARLVPGTRPMGVFTTGELQQLVHREGLPVGRRAVIVGAEHVSYSAVLTLRAAGVRPVAMITHYPRTQTFRFFDSVTRFGLRVPVWTETTVAGIGGRHRVDKVLLRTRQGHVREVAVDTVVFTGDWIPDHELARTAGLVIDRHTNGPACDSEGGTTVDGIFATGNLVYPVETADVAARRSASVGAAAAAWLRRTEDNRTVGGSLRVGVVHPLRWVVPNLVRAGRRSDQPTLLRVDWFLDEPRIRVEQDGRLLASHGLRRMVPNRSHRIPSDWYSAVDPHGGDVCISASVRS